MVNRNATVRTMPSFRDDYDFPMDMEDVDLMMNSSDYIPIPDQENVGTAYIRISLPELNVQVRVFNDFFLPLFLYLYIYEGEDPFNSPHIKFYGYRHC